MGRRLPADPAEAIGTAVVKYNYQVELTSIKSPTTLNMKIEQLLLLHLCHFIIIVATLLLFS